MKDVTKLTLPLHLAGKVTLFHQKQADDMIELTALIEPYASRSFNDEDYPHADWCIHCTFVEEGIFKKPLHEYLRHRPERLFDRCTIMSEARLAICAIEVFEKGDYLLHAIWMIKIDDEGMQII